MWTLLVTFVLAQQASSQQTQTSGPPKGFNRAFDILMAAKVQAYYTSIKTFEARFVQIYEKRYHGPQPPREGRVWTKKPGKMLWVYEKPTRKLFVCDGKRVWLYDPGRRQVLWRRVDLSRLPSAVRFLWGTGRILDEFYVRVLDHSKYGGPGKTVLKLVPKRPTSQFSHLLLVTVPKGRRAEVRESILYDVLGNKNRYIFKDVRVNVPIPDSKFSVKPPRGVRVIEARDDQNLQP